MVLPWFCRTNTMMRFIIIFIFNMGFVEKTRVEQHGLYTIPTLDVESQDGFYAIRMGFC